MNIKKIAAVAAAVVMAAGICAGVPAGKDNAPIMAINAEAATKETGKLDCEITHSGVSIDVKWAEVKNAEEYYVNVIYSTANIPFNITDNGSKIFAYKVVEAGATSISIPTIGLPLDIGGKAVHYNVQVMASVKGSAANDDTTYFSYYFESLDDLSKTDFSGGNTAAEPVTSGEPQTTVTGEAADVPGLPKHYSATGGDNQITVKWDKVSGAKSYAVSYCEAGKNRYTKAADVTSTSYTIKNLTGGKAYDIFILADGFEVGVELKNVFVGGSTSTEKADKKTDTAKVSAPTGFKASKKTNSITLSWGAVEGADMYRVYKYNPETKKYEKYKDVKSAKCTVSGLSA
ncbi:MAG: fibronectin type III domain-containing protein, partial [Eubacterium sp.]|nr:fibronectin type III domain-containing protein [Eubacterium sp.]